jgi:hypothetical protein
MKATTAVFGERFPWKVGAVFDDPEAARQAFEAVTAEAALPPSQVRMVKPGETAGKRRLEPESRGIGWTIVRAHLTLGMVGALVGMLVAGVLLLTGIGAFTSSPLVTAVLATVFGFVAGLLLGGLVSLRPDQDVLSVRLEDALRDGQHWAVLVHARDHGEERRAKDVLEGRHGRVIAGL